MHSTSSQQQPSSADSGPGERRRGGIRRLAAGFSAALLLSVVLAVAPASVAGAQEKPTLSLTSIDLNAGTVVITNHGDADADPNGIILCNFPAYAPLAGLDMIPAGGSITVNTGDFGVGFDAASGEMGLYTSQDYENPDAIIAYVEWGDPGHQRSPVAVAAGIWAEGAADASAGVLNAVSTTPAGPADWTGEAAAAQEDPPAEEEEELAQTGTEAWLIATVGGLLVLGGLSMLGMRRRRTLA